MVCCSHRLTPLYLPSAATLHDTPNRTIFLIRFPIRPGSQAATPPSDATLLPETLWAAGESPNQSGIGSLCAGRKPSKTLGKIATLQFYFSSVLFSGSTSGYVGCGWRHPLAAISAILRRRQPLGRPPDVICLSIHVLLLCLLVVVLLSDFDVDSHALGSLSSEVVKNHHGSRPWWLLPSLPTAGGRFGSVFSSKGMYFC